MQKLSTTLSTIIFITLTFFSLNGLATTNDPLPSWNAGPAKSAILDFIHKTTDKNNPQYVPVEQRLATFDQDGTLWVEQPVYTQVIFALDRVVALSPQHPEWKNKEPFKSVIDNDKNAIAKFTLKDLEQILMVTHAGMTVDVFQKIAGDWLIKTKDPRWHRPYTELIYQPMLEVLHLLQSNGYKTYIVTGGGQDFVRVYAQQVYHIPPEQVIGSAINVKYRYDSKGNGILMREPHLLLNNNFSGKPEDIYLFTGRNPQAAFGNSTGDQQMLEYAQASKGASLMMLVQHDDANREYAYGPHAKVGLFSAVLKSEAEKRGWQIISMKKDWKRVFPFDQA